MMLIFLDESTISTFCIRAQFIFLYQSRLESKHFTIYESWLHSKSNQLLKQTRNEI